MKFSTDQAMAHIRALDYPRPAGTEGERRAAEYISGEFDRHGLLVERQPVLASRAWGAWLRPALWLLVPALIAIGAATWNDGVFFVMGLSFAAMALILMVVEGPPGSLARRLPPRVGSQLLVARRGGPLPASARVIFLSSLDSPQPSWSRMSRLWSGSILILAGAELWMLSMNRPPNRPGWWLNTLVYVILALSSGFMARIAPVGSPWKRGPRPICVLAAIGFLLAMTWLGKIVPAPRAMALAVLGVIWIGAAFRAFEPFPDSGGAGPGDNRSGIALLLELARAWPKGASQRIEAWFVATGADGLGSAGARQFASVFFKDEEPKPTLFVGLESPGFGSNIILKGSGPAREIGEAAARDLWIPHLSAERGWFEGRVSRFGRIFAGPDCSTVVLAGSSVPLDGYGPGFQTSELDPALIAASASLATEIALRWARRQKGEGQDESRARSSQNPG
jgi:hypothetical protein